MCALDCVEAQRCKLRRSDAVVARAVIFCSVIWLQKNARLCSTTLARIRVDSTPADREDGLNVPSISFHSDPFAGRTLVPFSDVCAAIVGVDVRCPTQGAYILLLVSHSAASAGPCPRDGARFAQGVHRRRTLPDLHCTLQIMA